MFRCCAVCTDELIAVILILFFVLLLLVLLLLVLLLLLLLLAHPYECYTPSSIFALLLQQLLQPGGRLPAVLFC
jgi:hypothetical protein